MQLGKFQGHCYHCGRVGHKKAQCSVHTDNFITPNTATKYQQIKPNQTKMTFKRNSTKGKLHVMHANNAAFAPDDETAFAAAGACCSADAGARSSGACCSADAGARSSGACCNAGDEAMISDVAAHLAHLDGTLQSLEKNE